METSTIVFSSSRDFSTRASSSSTAVPERFASPGPSRFAMTTIRRVENPARVADHVDQVAVARDDDVAPDRERRPLAALLGGLEDLLDELREGRVAGRAGGAIRERRGHPLQRLRLGRAGPERALGGEDIGRERVAGRGRPVRERERGDEQRDQRRQESGPVHAGIQHLRRG